MEVASERENGRARGRHASLLLARPFFLVPTTCKRLLRRLSWDDCNTQESENNGYAKFCKA